MTNVNFTKYKELLEYISIATRQQLKAFCHHLHVELIRLITDLTYNLLYNTKLSINAAHIPTLRRHKRTLKVIGSRTGSLNKKRKTLRQKGHLFLPQLVKPVLEQLENDDNDRTGAISESDASAE